MPHGRISDLGPIHMKFGGCSTLCTHLAGLSLFGCINIPSGLEQISPILLLNTILCIFLTAIGGGVAPGSINIPNSPKWQKRSLYRTQFQFNSPHQALEGAWHTDTPGWIQNVAVLQQPPHGPRWASWISAAPLFPNQWGRHFLSDGTLPEGPILWEKPYVCGFSHRLITHFFFFLLPTGPRRTTLAIC